MIRWCAFCQRYQGEIEPFDDYSMTHGICERCSARKAFLHEEPSNLGAIRRFFLRVAQSATAPAVSAFELVREGNALGLDPVDLLLGIVQPVLRQIGDRWERGEATVAEEHRVTALCSTLIKLLMETDARVAMLRRRKSPTVLLVAAAHNYHTLGLQILAAFLLKNRISVLTVYPCLPPRDIVKLAQSVQPRIVAVSAAMPDHIQSAVEIDERLAAVRSSERPLVVVGGLALRSEASIPAHGSLLACRDLNMFLELASAPRARARRERPNRETQSFS